MVGFLTITAAAQFRNYTGFPVKVNAFPSHVLRDSGITHQIVNNINVRLLEKRVKKKGREKKWGGDDEISAEH